ncbi:hypothetical protein DRO26_03095 [Candidatus Bathyarchaeota archaeon]|nr:MAG: hypothetical protein DRO26_03095 [Candidatus Bathyarchaeota archaeon]
MPKKKFNSLKNFYRESKHYITAAGVGSIARRYFVLNAFDGALTFLGISMGSYVIGVRDPQVIIAACLGACLAMGISGFWGAYMAEKAERTRALKDLETAMFMNLKNTLLEKASKIATLWIAFVDGISPSIVTLTAITPFFLVYLGILNFETGFYVSIALILLMLFILGVFLGKISRENIFLQGVKMVAVGMVVATIFLLINLIF